MPATWRQMPRMLSGPIIYSAAHRGGRPTSSALGGLVPEVVDRVACSMPLGLGGSRADLCVYFWLLVIKSVGTVYGVACSTTPLVLSPGHACVLFAAWRGLEFSKCLVSGSFLIKKFLDSSPSAHILRVSKETRLHLHPCAHG